MLNPDDLFNPKCFEHPKLRDWQTRAQKAGKTPIVEVVRPREGLCFAPASIRVTIEDQDENEKAAIDDEPWEPQLALATVERGWRAPSKENESVRFGLLLKTLFLQPATRYGDGYFSSVLVAVLSDSGFAQDSDIADLLRYISVPAPLATPSRNECADNIKAVLSRAAQLLVARLEYQKDDARAILTKSIAYFLDERFSITSGKILGLYRDL